MIAYMMEGMELDFSHILIAEIHDRDFKTTISFRFSFLTFHLCKEALVLI